MTIEFKEIYNSAMKTISNNTIIKTITSNPLNVGLTIVFIMILIFTFVFREVDTDEGIFKIALRGGVYSSIFIIGLIFLYDKNIQETHKRDYSGGLMEEVFDGVDEASGGQFTDSMIGVTIRDPMFAK